MESNTERKLQEDQDVDILVQPLSFNGGAIIRPTPEEQQRNARQKNAFAGPGLTQNSMPPGGRLVPTNAAGQVQENEENANQPYMGNEGGVHNLAEGEGLNKQGEDPETNQEIPQQMPLAKPPPHVMTALGPMPLPPEIKKKIPEKFVAKPIVEEREIYVAKKEVQERTIEVPHVQYEHKFFEVPRIFNVRKLVPSVKEIVKEVPREVYKPVIEEKVIEIPQGVKYVEVPIEVPCLYPPKIVPKPVTQIVERVVETIKPIVKENIIEVPQTVVKNVPKIRTIEVPYYIPRYVEKIVEISYKPPEAGQFPQAITSQLPATASGPLPGYPPLLAPREDFPPSFAGTPAPFTTQPLPLSGVNDIKLPYEADIEIKVVHPQDLAAQERLLSGGRPHLHQPGIPGPAGSVHMSSHGLRSGGPRMHDVNPYSMQLPAGVQWGAPQNAPLPPEMQSNASGINYPNMSKIPPMMVTFPPEVGNVCFAGNMTEPDILTRAGVMPYQGFKRSGNAHMLFPPLPAHDGVPLHNGEPDIDEINAAGQNLAQAEKMIFAARNRGNTPDYPQRRVDAAACSPFGIECCEPCQEEPETRYLS